MKELFKRRFPFLRYECSSNNLINLDQLSERTNCDIKTIKQLGMYYNFIERPF